MTVKEVDERVQSIRDVEYDDEAAHSREDDLYEEVLGAIAAGHPDSASLAAAALKTKELHFARWCS